jgi:peptide/nickel transport system substrate-binding protein
MVLCVYFTMDISLHTSKVSTIKLRITSLYKSLSPEKVLLFWILLSLSCSLFFFAIASFNQRFLIATPAYGGEIREGLVGTPRFINPILATTEQDKDLSSLIFAGLTKRDAAGHLNLDMADTITVSDDKLRYDVFLKKAYFHDGKRVTTDDIIYTITLIQNPAIKSPHRIKWEGITIERKNDFEFSFVLKKPFPLFMETLTTGIIPKHVWRNLTDEQISLSDYNLHAVGSGPYVIKNITTDSGIPNTLTLTAHKKYTLGRPYIEKITIITFQNEKYLLRDFDNKNIDRIHGISPEKITNLNIATSSVHTSLLPRTFAIFFNPNKATILSNKEVRVALQMAIDKEKIVNQVLLNYGKVINDPYPLDENPITVTYNPEKAKEVLLKSKALRSASSTLEINLATANTDEMKKVAEMIIADWAKIGIKTNLAVYEVSDLNQNIIKDRDFEILLFGSITQTPSDLYAFWHSSQRTYPGLNISNYVSKKLDINLEILRESDDEALRMSAYEDVKKEFNEEVPGIFLFAPSLIYITRDSITSPLPVSSYENSSRFTLIETWYKYTDYVWPKTYNKNFIALMQNLLH